MSRSHTSWPWKKRRRRRSSVNLPITVASTFSDAKSARSSSKCSGGTDMTMRSWASLIHVSVYDRPWYFSGTTSRFTSAPSSSPISPTAELRPPAPQSVTAVYRPRSRATSCTSSTFFSVIGLPIWTAPLESISLSSVSSPEEKVAPWIPSRPVRPPATTIMSPVRARFSTLSSGMTPTVPQ